MRAAGAIADQEGRERAVARAHEWYETRRKEAPLPEFTAPAAALYDVWRGFWATQGDRSVIASMAGATVGPIPYAAKSQWLTDHGYTVGSDERTSAEHLIDSLDNAYLEHVRKSMDEAAEEREASLARRRDEQSPGEG